MSWGLLCIAVGGMVHLYQTSTQLPQSGWPQPVIERGPAIHIIGGFSKGSAVNSAECYNDGLDAWEMDAIQPMKCCRSGFGVAEMYGLLFAVGGTIGGSSSQRVECYNPRQNRWYEVAPMITSRKNHGVAAVTGLEDSLTGAPLSYIYSIGGEHKNNIVSSVERYNMWSNSWEVVAPLKTPKTNVGVGTVNNLVYVVGGTTSKEHVPDENVQLKTVECYNPRTNQWEEMPSKHHYCTCPGVAVLNNCLYAVGGYDGGQWLAVAECFNPSTNQWTVITPLTFPRTGITAATLKGEVYAIGGFNGALDGGQIVNTVEKYNPVDNTWKEVASLRVPRTVGGAAVSHIWTVQ